MNLLINWMLSALALWLLPRIIRGIEVRNYGTALIATVVIAIVNTVVGWPLRIITLPLTILTLGLFWLILNAFLLKLASAFVPGFSIYGFLPAFLGSIVFTVLHFILHHLFFYPNAELFR
ncbi:MAG TPA: phage holin family protein [Bryobacteraceae bacterium]|nr:phage holin family protein [Bryobacteraceae bacterium]